MTKRIISIALALTMLLSFPVFAESTETAADSGNMVFAKAMGIIDDGATGEDTVTRLELAEMFCNIFRSSIGLASSESVSFTDVPADKTAIAANVASLGIMNGVGGNLFAPDGIATYAQAVKATVVFLGYGQVAESKGGYPHGYRMQARDLKLISADYDENAPLTFEKAAELFKLALNVDFRRPAIFNPEAEYEIDDGVTYLQYYRNIVRVRGVVKSTYVSDISGLGKTAYNKIRVDGELLSFDPEKISAHTFFGHNADAYIDPDSKEIIYIEDAGTDVIRISAGDISGLNGDNIEYWNESGKKKKLRIDGYTRVLYNGTLRTSYTELDINPFASSVKDGSLTAIDSDRDGTFDIIAVDAYDSYVVTRIIDSKIYAENTAGVVIDLDALSYTEGKGYLIYNVLGQPVKVADIKKGDTLSVSRDKSGRITEIVVTIDEITGIIGAIEERDGKMFVTVNGAEFECSALVSSLGADDIVLGNKACIKFNKDGLVCDIDGEAYDLWNAAYLTGVSTGKGLDTDVKIKFFGEDGKWHIASLADKIALTDRLDKNSVSNIDKSGIISEIGTGDDGQAVRQPILYRLNASGYLKEIKFAAAPAESDTNAEAYLASYSTTKANSPFYMMKASNGSKTAEVAANGENALYWSHKDAGFNGTAFVTSSTVAFAVPPEEDRNDEGKYSVIDAASAYDDWETGATMALYASDDRPVVSVAVKVSSAAAEINVKTYAFIIENIEKTYNSETGAESTSVSGYMNGSRYEYTDPDNVLSSFAVTVDRGDMLRLAVNGYNEITQAQLAFDASEKAVYKKDGTKAQGGSSDDTYSSLRFVCGKVKHIDSDIMTVSTTSSDGLTAVEVPYTVANHKYVKVTKSPRGIITVAQASVSDIIGSDDYGDEATFAVVHTQAARAWGVVIYEGF